MLRYGTCFLKYVNLLSFHKLPYSEHNIFLDHIICAKAV